MPTVRSIEKRIFELEGFRVQIRTLEGADIRGDRDLAGGYRSYQRQSPNTATVEEWKASRFRPSFVGLDVKVLLADGTTAHGRMLLLNVRSAYS